MYSFLYVPIDTKENALSIAKILIDEKLAGCVNIIPNITSCYERQGKFRESNEFLMLIKVNNHSIKCCRERIESLHLYDTPCIAEIKVNSVNKCFANWIDKQIDEDHGKNLSFSKKLEKKLNAITNRSIKEKLLITANFLEEINNDSNQHNEFFLSEAVMCIDDLSKMWPKQMRKRALSIREKLISRQSKLLKRDSIWTLIKKCFAK